MTVTNRYGAVARIVFALSLASLVSPSGPVSAVSQSISMIYGDATQKPVFVIIKEVADYGTYSFLTCSRSDPSKVGDMGTRRFLRIASYWDQNVWKKYVEDPRLLPELKPESANQHGRLYLPTRDEPAIVVTTRERIGVALPIPGGTETFVKSCVLTSEDLAVARRLGIPGSQE